MFHLRKTLSAATWASRSSQRCVGLFFINVAAFLPLAGFSPRGRAGWRWVNVVLIICVYTGETMQALRALTLVSRADVHGCPDLGLRYGLISTLVAVAAGFKVGHVAGITWLTACAGIWTQTALGESVLTPSLLMAVTVGALLTWGYATLRLWPLQGRLPVRCPEEPV